MSCPGALDPLALPSPGGCPRGPADLGPTKGMGGGLQGRRPTWTLDSRPASFGGPKHGAGRRAALGRHEADGAQDRERLPALRDRQRFGSSGGGYEVVWPARQIRQRASGTVMHLQQRPTWPAESPEQKCAHARFSVTPKGTKVRPSSFSISVMSNALPRNPFVQVLGNTRTACVRHVFGHVDVRRGRRCVATS